MQAHQVCWSGIVAQVSWHKTLRYLLHLQTSSSISAKQCVLLNGTLFLGSIVLFSHLLTPLLLRIGGWLAHLDGVGIEGNGDDQAVIEKTAKWASVQAFVEELSSSLFTICWLFPYVCILFSVRDYLSFYD